MGYKKATVVCQCGCSEEFLATLTYRSKKDGGGLRTPKYKRGHHPNSTKNQLPDTPWNKGLKKGDHPSISRMGYQTGHKPYNDWNKINHSIATDGAFKARWIESKKGPVPWNKGLTVVDYPKPLPTGKDHAAWKGGHRGAVDTAAWQRLRLEILKRDNYTCQECGDRNRKGRGSRINLEVHHIQAICDHPELALTSNNCVTLCRQCHYQTHNFGGKALRKRGMTNSAKKHR